MEAKHQKYKGRVVFRGDIVKDDSGAYAVFTEVEEKITVRRSEGRDFKVERVQSAPELVVAQSRRRR